MNVSESIVPLVDKKFRIYPIGDMHLTLKTFQYERFKAYVQAALDDPTGVVFILGDVSDARKRDHRFFDPGMIHSRFLIEEVDILEDLIVEEAIELLAPVAHKVAGVIRGNHHQAGFTRRLCRGLSKAGGCDVPDLGDRALVRLRAMAEGRRSAEFGYTVFVTHVDSGSRKPGAQINRGVDNLISFDADLFLSAHSHRASFYKQPRLSLTTRGKVRLITRHSVFINAGCFLEPYAEGANSYADAKNLPLQNDSTYVAEVVLKREAAKNEVLTRVIDWAPG